MRTTQAHADYQRIERAIRFLEENADQQPELGDLARYLHLSESHLQRLFSRWAGISPKRFLQYVTTEHAKRLLEASQSVLDVTHEVGLSNPSRLHGLMVQVEGMTPGEIKQEGEGLRIAYGFHPSPFGLCFLAVTQRGICALRFLHEEGRGDIVEGLRSRFRRATLVEDSHATAPYIQHVFSAFAGAKPEPLYVLLKGTNLQINVWRALLEIPAGSVLSYGDLARQVGRPKAVRAVASAVAQNPVQYLIPCHRVIRSTGAFGGYQGGEARKRALIAWETAREGRGNGDARVLTEVS